MKTTLAYLNVATLAETDVTILGYLAREFNVHWFIIYEPSKNSSLNIETIKKFSEDNGIALHIHTRTFRIRRKLRDQENATRFTRQICSHERKRLP